MTDPIKEREALQNTYRVSMNLLVLLDIGLWPGKHAIGIEECKNMIQALRDDAANKLQSLIPPPSAPPAGSPVPAAPVPPVTPAAAGAEPPKA